MDGDRQGAGPPGTRGRLARLRAEHGFAEFALEQSTTGTDTNRLVTVVVDPTRRLTSLTINTGDRAPALDVLSHAVGEALTAAEAARSLHSYAIARDEGLVGPTPSRRRFLSMPDRSSIEAAVMAQPAEPPSPRPPARSEPSKVFAALGLDDEELSDPARDTGPGRTTHGSVVGTDDGQGARVTLGDDGWTSSLQLEPWLASASTGALARTILAAYQDAYEQHDRREAAAGADPR